MTLSRQSLEILQDLIEIKVSSLQVQDREDTRELNKIRKCRQELLAALSQTSEKDLKALIKPQACSEKPCKRPSYLGR